MNIPTEYFQIFVYLMFFFAIISYATLDGFDLGVGTLHLFTKGDNERRLMINAIGPVWDGNTTWIVIGSGILFAGFPIVFANLSSNLYIPTMLLLFGFMLRGTAVEFRSKSEHLKWRKAWDVAFFVASLILALMVGIFLGNLIRGIPLNKQGEYREGLIPLFTPYPLLISVFGLCTFMMHGSLYMLMKTEDAFHEKMRKWAKRLIFLFLVFWLITTITTFISFRHMVKPFYNNPILMIFPLLSLSCIAGIFYSIKKKWDGRAFAFSCFSIVFLLILVIIGLYPNIVISSIRPEQYSLTLFNSSASRIALIVISLITFLGIPLGYFYGTYIYRIFRGKVKIDPMSY